MNFDAWFRKNFRESPSAPPYEKEKIVRAFQNSPSPRTWRPWVWAPTLVLSALSFFILMKPDPIRLDIETDEDLEFIHQSFSVLDLGEDDEIFDFAESE